MSKLIANRLAAIAAAFVPVICQAQIVVELDATPGSPAWESAGTWTESNATIDVLLAPQDPGPIQLTITPQADANLFWRFSLTGPDNVFPGPGTYPAQRFPFEEAGFAGVDISSFNGCNTGQGEVVVYEVAYEPDGTLAMIAADARYACGNSNAYSTGKIRFNSSVALEQPGAHAIAVPEQVVSLGETVSLDGSSSFSDDSTIASFSWKQLEGEPVAITNASSSIGTFLFPTDKGSYQQLLFELTVTDALNRSDSVQVQVISGTLNLQDSVNVFERGNNYVWTREIAGYGTSPSSPFTSFGASNTIVSVRNSSRIVDISPPKDRELRIGGYLAAQRSGTIDLLPGMTVWDCSFSGSNGTPYESLFDIIDLSFEQSGLVDRIGFDFDARCVGGARNTYFGSVRLGTYAPAQIEYPRALAGNDKRLYAGEPGFLNGVFSRSPDNTLQSFQWTQVAGPAVDIAEPTSAIARITAPDTITEESIASFRLDVTDGAGRSASDIVNLSIVPTSAPRTFFQFVSDPNTFIGQGVTAYLRDGQDTSMTTIIDLLGPAGAERDRVQVSDQNTRSWSFFLFSGDDGKLQPGYQSDTFDGDPNNVLPQLSVANTGRGCNRPSGALNVLDVQRDAAELIDELAIDFGLICQGESGEIRGAYRFNSSVPNSFGRLVANAGPDQIVQEGNQVTLVDNSGPNIKTTWTQNSGPALNLSFDGKRAYFVPPTIPAGQSRYLSFRLTNQSDDGGWGEDFVVVKVDDNGRTEWDNVSFDKYIDKPHAFVSSNGQRFGLRTVEELGNLARLSVGGGSLVGTSVGAEAVLEEIMPASNLTFKGVSSGVALEYFSQGNLPGDYKLIAKDTAGQWQLISSMTTGDGLFVENGVSRLRVTVPSQSSAGGSFDLDNQAESTTVQLAVVRLGAPSAVPPQGGGGGSGGGGGGSVSVLSLLFAIFLAAAKCRRHSRRMRDRAPLRPWTYK